jgi:hypothetical protein
VCGIPLIRRQLQVLRTNNWRQAILVVCQQDRELIESAIGDPTSLGMQVSFLPAPNEIDLPIKACRDVTEDHLLIVEANYVIEEALLKSLVATGTTSILWDGKCDGLPTDDGYAGAAFLFKEDLEKLAFNTDTLPWPTGIVNLPGLKVVNPRNFAEVRRHVKPFWCEVKSIEDAEQCKRALVYGAQKQTLDVLAWYFNRPLENWLTFRLADWPITPNQITVITSLVGFIVSGLFLIGFLWPAALLTFMVNILDGVDGKLARVKVLHDWDSWNTLSIYFTNSHGTSHIHGLPTDCGRH